MNPTNKILLLVGESGSGKSTIEHLLEIDFGMRPLKSYTTRPKRSASDDTHTFISDADVAKYESEMVAKTVFDGNVYFSTQKQVEESDVYVIDVDGINSFVKNYNGNKIPIVIYLSASTKARMDRMRDRGDSEAAIAKRIAFDKSAFFGAASYADAVIDAERNPIKVLAEVYKHFILA